MVDEEQEEEEQEEGVDVLGWGRPWDLVVWMGRLVPQKYPLRKAN